MNLDQNNFSRFPNNDNRQNTRISAFFPLLFALMLAIGVLLGYNIQPGGGASGFKGTGKLNYILNLIENEYVDTVNSDDLIDKAITGMLAELDPHSVYMSATDVKRSSEELSGKFGGVGIQFIINDDTLMVTHLVENGPAQSKGILPFDRILKAGKKKLSNEKISNDDVLNTLRGDYGTSIKLEIFRPSSKKTFTVDVIRNAIPVPSIECAIMIQPSIGFIRISQFGENTYSEFLSAAKKLRSAGMKKLILDLRDNGGGYLQAAQNICDQFLPDQTMIVYTQGVNQGRQEYRATNSGEFEKTDLVVLVNHNSASASEIVAGAIQDNDRGTIVGRRTFGKGLVQQQFGTFTDGSALRLTVSRYYTPSGRCIQRPYGKGIDYFHDGIDRYRKNEFYVPDSSLMVDSLVKYTLKKKRKVYSGGGIMPDVFVPFDTSFNTFFYSMILDKNCINSFSFRYAESNKLKLKSFIDFNDFEKRFLVSDELWNEFLSYSKSKGVDNSITADVNRSKKWISTLVKAEIARLTYNSPGYYYVRMNNDDEVKQAIRFK